MLGCILLNSYQLFSIFVLGVIHIFTMSCSGGSIIVLNNYMVSLSLPHILGGILDNTSKQLCSIFVSYTAVWRFIIVLNNCTLSFLCPRGHPYDYYVTLSGVGAGGQGNWLSFPDA